MSTKITRTRKPVDVTEFAPSRIVRLQGGGLRFLDAHEIPQKDFQVVTRPFQGFDTTQHWRITDWGNGSTIQQVSSGRFLDAHEIAELDFRVVTRPQQDNEHPAVADPGVRRRLRHHSAGEQWPVPRGHADR